MNTRVIALVDMDCFYCQVEEKLNPELQGKPVAVVQYNLWREGGIIAANYLAKEKGVTKGMWKHEAKDLCPEIQFARVAELRGRADLTKYREAGNQVVEVLTTFTNLLERASIDEAYLDITEAVKQEMMKGISNIPLEKLETTHIVGLDTEDFISNISGDQDTDGFCEDDLKLAIGGIIVERIRASIYERTGYRCSAGIAHNKILAKLVCGLHKPNKQTILPGSAVLQFFSELPLKKIKRLGGKFGKKVSEELNIMKVGELLKFSEKELAKKFDLKTGQWLYNIARGIDNEPVSPKILSKSLSCCKRFPGKNALFKQKDVEYWINELAIEVAERLSKDRETNNRKAKVATVSFVQDVNKNDVNTSKTFSLRSYEADIIARDALDLIRKFCRKSDGSYYLKYLGISVGGFEEIKNIKDIKFFFEKNKSCTGKSLEVKTEIKTEDERQQEKNNHVQTLEPEYVQGATGDERVHSDIDSSLSIYQRSIEKSISNYAGDEINKIESIEEPSIFARDANEANNSTHLMTEETESKKSFFTRYFTNVSTEFSCNSNDGSASKDASKSFTDIHKDLKNDCEPSGSTRNCGVNEYSEKKIEVSRSCENRDSYKNSDGDIKTSETKSNSHFHENNDIENQIITKCEECGKEIGINELSSHMDYHFALKLQDQDSSIRKNNSRIVFKNSDQSSRKRKASQFGNASLDLFLTTVKSGGEEEATEVCEMCNKKIRISELLSHFDYHTAKNLHEQLNNQNRSCEVYSSVRNAESSNGILRYLKRKSS